MSNQEGNPVDAAWRDLKEMHHVNVLRHMQILNRKKQAKDRKAEKLNTKLTYDVQHGISFRRQGSSEKIQEANTCATSSLLCKSNVKFENSHQAEPCSSSVDMAYPLETKELLALLQRDLNRLNVQDQDEEKLGDLNIKRKAIKNVYQELFVKRKLSIQTSQELFVKIGKHFMKCFNDPSENVRETSIRIVTEFVRVHDNVMDYLPYLFPVIMSRLTVDWIYDETLQIFSKNDSSVEAHKRGRIQDDEQANFSSFREPSEEIRLSLCEVIHSMLSRVFDLGATSLLHPYFVDIVKFVVAGINDPFPDLKIKSCDCMALLSDNMVSGVKHFAVALVRTAKEMLFHRHSKVRIAGIAVIQKLVLCPNVEKCKGAGTEAILDLIGHRDENILPIAAFYRNEIKLNYFAKLDQDSNQLVRQRFYDMVGTWLTNLPDRYDYESRLMPYLLSGLNDDFPMIATQVRDCIDKLGRRYEEEHPDNVIEKRQYGIDGDVRCNHTKPLPPPFQGRPPLGSRLYVRSKCRQFIKTLLNELSNWMSKTRSHAANLLKCVIVYSEEHTTVDIHEIVKTLLMIDITESNDDAKDGLNSSLKHQLLEISELVGRFVDPEAYVPLMLPHIYNDIETASYNSTKHRRRAIQVITRMLEGSLSKQSCLFVDKIVDSLWKSDLLSSESKGLGLDLMNLCEVLVFILQDRGKRALEDHFQATGRLTSFRMAYQTIFQILLILRSSEQLHARAEKALLALGKSQGIETMEDLYQHHFKGCLERVLETFPSPPMWRRKCYQQVILEALVQQSKKDLVSDHVFSSIAACVEPFFVESQHAHVMMLSDIRQHLSEAIVRHLLTDSVDTTSSEWFQLIDRVVLNRTEGKTDAEKHTQLLMISQLLRIEDSKTATATATAFTTISPPLTLFSDAARLSSTIQIQLQFMETSASWEIRSMAIDSLRELVAKCFLSPDMSRALPDIFTKLRVFDALRLRVEDSRDEVQLKAILCLSQSVQVLRDGKSPVEEGDEFLSGLLRMCLAMASKSDTSKDVLSATKNLAERLHSVMDPQFFWSCMNQGKGTDNCLYHHLLKKIPGP